MRPMKPSLVNTCPSHLHTWILCISQSCTCHGFSPAHQWSNGNSILFHLNNLAQNDDLLQTSYPPCLWSGLFSHKFHIDAWVLTSQCSEECNLCCVADNLTPTPIRHCEGCPETLPQVDNCLLIWCLPIITEWAKLCTHLNKLVFSVGCERAFECLNSFEWMFIHTSQTLWDWTRTRRTLLHRIPSVGTRHQYQPCVLMKSLRVCKLSDQPQPFI